LARRWAWTLWHRTSCRTRLSASFRARPCVASSATREGHPSRMKYCIW
jgi:hypothetical protein